MAAKDRTRKSYGAEQFASAKLSVSKRRGAGSRGWYVLACNSIIVLWAGAQVYAWPYIKLMHDFVPDPWLIDAAIWLAVLFSVMFMGALVYLSQYGSIERSRHWADMPVYKKVFLVLFGPLYAFGVYFTLLSTFLPQLITQITGTQAFESDLVQRDRSHSRGECRYQLEIESVPSSMFFQYCISEKDYARFGEGKRPATLVVKKSFLGRVINEIHVCSKGAGPWKNPTICRQSTTKNGI